MNTSLFRSTAIALALGLTGVAQAATCTAPNQCGNFTSGTPFVVNDTTQPVIGSATVTVNAAGEYVFNVEDPNPQDATTVGNALEAAFGAPATISNNVVGQANLSGGTFTFDPAGAATFDYLAVHFGGSELFLHFASAIQAVTLTLTNDTIGGLSNFRAYSGTPTVPIPGAAWLFLSALGVFGLGRKFAGGRQTGSLTTA
jgi:hypothetical protein